MSPQKHLSGLQELSRPDRSRTPPIQPRDGNWRSSYAVYDVDNQVVNLRRLEYDIEKAQEKILKAGLPEMLANRLSLGK